MTGTGLMLGVELVADRAARTLYLHLSSTVLVLIPPPVIGDRGGAGLMQGVELVADTATKTPAKAETLQAFERLKALGLSAILFASSLESAADLGVLVGEGGHMKE
ncbi:hypothetical protein CLOP_g5271 [Closterium sp. NIES-67]|nr:hypothetical protein CLOP_g5271 [Closterium sp. NIES-67]